MVHASRSSFGSGRRRGASAVDRYLEAARARPPLDSSEVEPLYGLPTQSALLDAVAGEEAGAPDLLHPRPCTALDRRAALKALEFAFTTGDSSGIASRCLSTAAIAASEWQPECFAHELFLDELIDKCLSFRCAGKPAPIDRAHLRRLLCHPPADPAIAGFRHGILAELERTPALRAALDTLYRHTVRVLELFDESTSQSRYDLPRWRLDLLGALRELFDALEGPFEHAGSGLSRLHAFGQRIRGGRGYRELCSLLDFEGDMARVDLQVRVGADGKLRALEVRQVTENARAPFYRGPFSRFFFRIWTFLRGYRIGESELVERWFEHVYLGVAEHLPAVLQLRGDLEFYLSACHFRDTVRARGLEVCTPELVSGAPEAPRRIEGLFNPLLLQQGHAVVPCDLSVDSFRRSCILTGPNSGGKTRLLQALAFTQLLGQAGFYVPARHAVLRRARGLFVSLSQESAADQKEGRLGTELLRIRSLFEHAAPGALVILDELCSGTNPSEGEEIFQLVVELLRELEPEVFITTHFLQFAQQLEQRAEALALCFLQVELDAAKLPTYQFVPGVASTSLAQQTAARLGVTRDELLGLVRRRPPT
jgi:DNA mismatch repair protein MutS2